MFLQNYPSKQLHLMCSLLWSLVLSNGVMKFSQKKCKISVIYRDGVQIKDDLFDYLSKNIIGKPVGIDIKEQRWLCRLFILWKRRMKLDRKYYFNTIKRYNNDQKRVKELIEFVKKSGGLDYAIGVMKDFPAKSKKYPCRIPWFWCETLS